jgi:hypothetical protein
MYHSDKSPAYTLGYLGSKRDTRRGSGLPRGPTIVTKCRYPWSNLTLKLKQGCRRAPLH